MDAYRDELAVQRAQFHATAARGRPKVPEARICEVALRYRGNEYVLKVNQRAPGVYEITVNTTLVLVGMKKLNPYERRVTVGGTVHRVVSMPQGAEHLVEVDGIQHRISRDTGGAVRAPSPAVVLSIPVEEGDEVHEGSPLVVLEAMKMELVVSAPFTGRVRSVDVITNVQVDAGTPLVSLEPLATDTAKATCRVEFRGDKKDEAASERARWERCLAGLRGLMLGYDVPPAQAKKLLVEWGELSCAASSTDAELLAAEHELLELFVDVHTLFRRERTVDDDGTGRSEQEYLITYMRSLDTQGEQLPSSFRDKVKRALAHYGVDSLERRTQLEQALLRIYKARQNADLQGAAVSSTLERRVTCHGDLAKEMPESFRYLLDRLVSMTSGRFPIVHDLAREVRHLYYDKPLLERVGAQIYEEMDERLAKLDAGSDLSEQQKLMEELQECPFPLLRRFASHHAEASERIRGVTAEVMLRRLYRIRDLRDVQVRTVQGHVCAFGAYERQGTPIHAVSMFLQFDELLQVAQDIVPLLEELRRGHDIVVDFLVWKPDGLDDPAKLSKHIKGVLIEQLFDVRPRRVTVSVAAPVSTGPYGKSSHFFTYRTSDSGFHEDNEWPGLHPMMAKRVHLWRLRNFELSELPSVEDVYLFHCRARSNPADERLVAIAEVRDLTPTTDAGGRVRNLPGLERMLVEALAGIRLYQAKRGPRERLHNNRVLLYAWPVVTMRMDDIYAIVRRLAPATEGLGLAQVAVHLRIPDEETGEARPKLLKVTTGVQGLSVTFEDPTDDPVKTLTAYEQQVVRLRSRGLTYPYELINMVAAPRDQAAGQLPPGEFQELDLDPENLERLVPVDRPPGQNESHIVVGIIKNFTAKYPEGMTRVALLGDASKAMGSLAEAECRRIMAALDLAREMNVPLEWYALSAGAKIAMDSGTENMDWISAVLRKIVEFTQDGFEINVLVCGINVGAQPYWNAEATMLMHTRGILIMTPQSAMVLTGKQALDYSGSVSADDNFGIGGYERIMGPNGQAQYFADDIAGGCRTLLRYYDHSYVSPGERFPRRAHTNDPSDRDVGPSPHTGEGFDTIGDVFNVQSNPGRKKPFDIRSVMRAVADQDHEPLERWRDMQHAEIAVVWDAHIGGIPVALLGLESTPVRRTGYVPADGPGQWTGGTLFPLSSKKVARAINAASGRRPLVVLANLSGFDGSPESMRKLQLEYGAEIGRAVINFDGPIVFAVVSRYHGGAFVVFSKTLNDNFESVALEGTYASVIGGAPAAAVVFARDVKKRTQKDPRLAELQKQLSGASGAKAAELRKQLAELTPVVHSQKLAEVAAEFDSIHSVQRAKQVGSLDHIISPETLRPFLIEAVERGMQKSTQ